MQNFKKFIVSLSIIFISVVALTGSYLRKPLNDYEQSTETVFSKQKDGPLKISVFTDQKYELPTDDNKIYKWIKKKFGVTFKWDVLTGNKDQKVGYMIASFDLPDLIYCNTPYFKQAACLKDIKPLIEKYCPNLMKHYASVWKQMLYKDSELDANGDIINEHIYGLPSFCVYDGTYDETYYNLNAFWIQKAVLKEFNYPKITTIDEYFDLIEKYIKKYPSFNGKKNIPFSLFCADWEAYNLWNPANFLAGYPNDGDGHVDYENGKYIYRDNFCQDNSLRWLKIMNAYYNKGLVDEEIFLDSRDSFLKKIESGKLLGFFCQGWEFLSETQNIPDEKTYCPLPVVFDKKTTPYYVNMSTSVPGYERDLSFSAKCSDDKAIKILKFMDEMIKEENQKVLYWGIENEDYMMDKKTNKPYRTQKQIQDSKDPSWQFKNRAQLWALMAPKLEGRRKSGYTNSLDLIPSEYLKSLNKTDRELLKAYSVSSYVELMEKNVQQNPFWYPLWKEYPDTQNPEEIHAMVQCEVIAAEYYPKLIMASPSQFDAIWSDFSSKIKPYTITFNAYMQKKLDKLYKIYGTE